jgi:hypothetical protein
MTERVSGPRTQEAASRATRVEADRDPARAAWRGVCPWRVGFALAIVVPVALHLTCLTEYGWFRDELYYVACARRIAWGYVDHPPLVAWVLGAVRALVGESLAAMRLVAVACGVATTLVSASVARRLGGGRAAELVTALALAWSPVHLYVAHVYSMNSMEPLLWTACVRLSLELFDPAPSPARVAGPRTEAVPPRDVSRVALGLGLVLGLAVLTKHAAAILGFALAAGVLVTPSRRVLRSRAPYVAAVIALLVVGPHASWQVEHGFPTLEFARNAAATKNAPLGVGAQLVAQLLLVHPANAPLWLAGALWLVGARAARPYRGLGVAFVVLLACVIGTRSKPYYLASIYPSMFAAGAVVLTQRLAPVASRTRRVVAVGTMTVWAALGAVAIPFGMPILEADRFAAYQRALGVSAPKMERADVPDLPQVYADMFGWEELARAAGRAVDGLPEGERSRARILAGNYGEAAALEVLGRPLALPPVTSGHNAYFTWGSSIEPDSVVVVAAAGVSDAALEAFFDDVRTVERVRCVHCMPLQSDAPIRVARGMRRTPEELFRSMRRFR